MLAHRPPPQVDAPQGQIQLDVTVTDGGGRLVPGLTRDQFSLLDNTMQQPILSFREVDGDTATKADPPVEVILLVDLANASFTRVGFERYEIEKYLRQNNGHLALPTTLMIFSDQGVKAQPQPSSDGNELAKALEQFEASVHSIPLSGGYDAMERLSISLKALNLIAAVEQRKPGRKLLLWVGPGWPMLESPNFQFSQRNRQGLFNNIVNTSNDLREARITLYSIFPAEPEYRDAFRADYYKGYLKGIASAKQVEPGDLSLSVLAVHSGGQAMTASGDLGSKIAQCAAEATPYYVVGFDPPRAEHADEYHAVGIKVSTPGLHAQTVSSYYAQPVPGP